MTRNYVCCTPYLSKHTLYDRVFCCTSLKWWHLQMLFSFFSKFWCSGLLVGGGGKGQKWPKMRKKNCLTSYIMNCTSYDFGFWYTCVKWWYFQQFFFHFFQNSDFLGFSKSINKCQKEILRRVPPSWHMWFFIKWYIGVIRNAKYYFLNSPAAIQLLCEFLFPKL